MTIGIIPNTSKPNIWKIVKILVQKLENAGLNFLISESIMDSEYTGDQKLNGAVILDHDELFEQSDVVISIGGDGTMLNTAFETRKTETPLIGINYGKLGFLAEFDINNIDTLVDSLKKGNFVVEERMALEGFCREDLDEDLYAVNDIVIDRGRWPKMIEMEVKADDEYVSTFSADGIIIATPTGSTGYSLSTGGPIVSPKSDVITLSPISPHTLTMRPLVLASSQKISITARSPHTTIQVICDGQRVNYFKPPTTIEIYKSKKHIKLVHTKNNNYFEILRNKLFWGLDVRANKKNDEV